MSLRPVDSVDAVIPFTMAGLRAMSARRRASSAPTARQRSVTAAASDLDAMRSALLRWYAGARRDLPWRRTRDPYAILVSEVMLQQTQVARVLPRYEAWLERWPTAPAPAAAPAARRRSGGRRPARVGRARLQPPRAAPARGVPRGRGVRVAGGSANAAGRRA